MDINSKLGKFAQVSSELRFVDADGNAMNNIVAGKTIVHGPFGLFTKDQVAIVIAVVTESMFNSTNEKTGKPVYEFQSVGWRPQANAGDIQMMDLNNLADKWACQPDKFTWVGTTNDAGLTTYLKPGKPQLAIKVPVGTVVESLEGPRIVAEGDLVSIISAEKGDYYVWPADVVKAYVKPFVNT